MRISLSERTKTCLLLSLFLLGAISWVSLIFNNNLWVDEAFTASIIRGSWPEVWKRTAEDTLPPFYNLFTRLLTGIFGYSAPVMKASSVLPMLLSMLLSVTLLRAAAGFRVSLLYTLFLCSMPHFRYYGVEIRPYSWGLFAASGAGIFFLRILSRDSASPGPVRDPGETRGNLRGKIDRNWVLFAVFTAFSGYTHHFALVSAGILWFFLLLSLFRPESGVRFRPWLQSLILTAALYLPGLLLTVRQIRRANRYFSLSPLTVRTFFSDLRFPFVTNVTPLSALLLILTLAEFLLSAAGSRPDAGAARWQRIPALFLMLDLPCTILFGYAASLLTGSSLFTARYLVPSLALLWLGVSLSAGQGRRTLPLWLLLTALISALTYTAQFREEYDPGVNRMTEFFDSALGPEDGYIIYENNYQIELCFRYYYPELPKYDWEHADEIRGTVWYFEVDGFEKELDKASLYGYNIEDMGEMSFDRYHFHLYRLRKTEARSS